MSLMDITAESLSRDLSREVPEVYVIVAKHSVLGMDDDSIREVIGCTKEELSEVLNDPLYREIRLIAGAHQAESVVDLTTGWDKLEQVALTNLHKRAPFVKDEETLLRIAAVANKAQRRHQAGKEDGVLDATNGKSVRINLTTRLVQSFSRPNGDSRDSWHREDNQHHGRLSGESFVRRGRSACCMSVRLLRSRAPSK
jgi:hypothetical protein